MTFLNPWNLLWVAAAAPIVALYFLKLKRKKVPVSSTWLWTRSIQDLRVNAPFQKLRKNLLLILQLLLVLLATLGVAEPAGRKAPPEDKRWVLLIDRSASMQMKDVAPSRLAKAKEVAREILHGCGPRDEVMVVAFSNRTQVMTPLTSSRPAAERAIDAIEPADTATRLQEAFRIAVSAVQPFKNREIVILSDGRFEPVTGSAEGIDLRYVPIGAKPRNAALGAIEVRRPSRTDDPWTVFAQIDLFHDKEEEVPVELYVNGQLKAVKKVKMAPHAGTAVLFEVTKPEPQVVQVKLALEDDLDVDNRAWAVVRPDRARLLLAAAGPNFFLDKALAHLKDLEAFRTDDIAKAPLGDYEVVVLDRVMPEPLPEGRYLILGAVPKWEGIKIAGESAAPAVVDWDRRHPVARMVNFAKLYVKSAPKVELAAFGLPVVEGTDAPLVFSWERGRTRAVVVTFDLLQSDWPLRPSFPLFLVNALEWLREDTKSQPKPGEPLRLRLADDETELSVSAPGGREQKLTGDAGRDVVYGDTDRCGLYSVTRKSGTNAVALNLLDPHESSGAVVQELKTSTGRTAVTGAAIPAAQAFWKWFVLGVLVLLLVEWWVYHRRIEI